MSVIERPPASLGRSLGASDPPPSAAVPLEVCVLFIGEVARMIDHTPETTLRYARDGRLVGRETPGGWLFSSRCVRAFLGELVEFSAVCEPAMNCEDTAVFLRRSTKTIGKYVQAGIIPASSGRHIRCSKDALLRWLEKR